MAACWLQCDWRATGAAAAWWTPVREGWSAFRGAVGARRPLDRPPTANTASDRAKSFSASPARQRSTPAFTSPVSQLLFLYIFIHQTT